MKRNRQPRIAKPLRSQLSIDERLVFKGEVARAPGVLVGCENFVEPILFSSDPAILSVRYHSTHNLQPQTLNPKA